MQIYNSLTRRKEAFVPQIAGKVSMYACGITAYDLCHIGHARSAVVFDVLARYLRYLDNEVTFVRNFTDVDDKIIARANQEGLSSEEVAEKYIATFHEDMDRLGVERATIEPRATEYITEMIELCQLLISQDNAYSTPSGDVYFRVRSFPSYGKLSGRSLDDMIAGSRVAPGEEKQDPMDFALWKSAKPGEPSWKSPWGQGRPGWHIECSAMSEKNLPLPLDIHGGGQDLIFPHHENEIAQSEAALGKELAKFWVHNGFVQVDSEKMSKSVGNFKTIRDILQQHLPEVLRFFLLSKHYRSPIDFTPDSMDEAERGLRRIYEALAEVEKLLTNTSWKNGSLPPEVEKEFDDAIQAFYSSMDDDFNTAAALGHIFALVRIMNRILEEKSLRSKEGAKVLALRFQEHLLQWRKILGLFFQTPQDFLDALRQCKARRINLDIPALEQLMEQRLQARQQKDFTQADALRDNIASMGVELRDTPQGQVWDLD